ncbi:cuticle protein 16.8 [Trichonephila clavipes]|nr:cuticle protein 16.8 [Trichonephila clavipes]
MQVVDMVYVDVVRFSIVLLIINATWVTTAEEKIDHDLKRLSGISPKPDPWVRQPSEKRSDHYMDEYETTEERIELDHRPEDSKRHPHPHQLQDEYHEEKTVEYIDEEKVPQSYKFGFEIKDEHEGHQYRHEQKDAKGNIHGRFGYRDAKGQYRQVDYVADNHGFRANVKTNEPGIVDQNPANVEIQKDKNEASKEYSHHVDVAHSPDQSADYKHEKGAESEQYHRQPVKEAPSHGDGNDYETHHDQSVNYDSHSHHPYPSHETEKHYSEKNEHSSKYEEGPTAVIQRYFVKEGEPEHEYNHPSNQYQDVPDAIYEKSHSDGTYVKRRPKNHKAKSHARRPSTYQYELDTDGHSYRYAERPFSQGYEPPQDDHSYHHHNKEYHDHVHVQPVQHVHAVPARENTHIPDEYEGYKHSHADKDAEHQHTRVILPQVVEQDSHSYRPENHPSHDISEHGYTPKEKHVVKYEYSDENKLGQSEVHRGAPEHVPTAHQYIQVIEVPHQPSSDAYGKEKISYEHKHKTEPGHQAVVLMDERDKIHHHQKEAAYEERNYEHPHPNAYHVLQHNNPVQYEGKNEDVPKTNHQESLRYNVKANQQEHLKEAVLELNADVYKQLIESKSPGRRLVAIPINHLSDDPAKSHLYPKSGKAHGILHIPLDDKSQSTVDLKNLPLVLQIPQDKTGSYQKPQGIYNEHALQKKAPAVYTHYQPTVVSVPKAVNRHHKNKEYSKTKWIPMTPSWNQIRRKSHNENDSPATRSYEPPELGASRVALKVSNGEVYQILQGENSGGLSDLHRTPSTLSSRTKKVKPSLYALSTSSALNHQGHRIVSVLRS